MIPLHGFPNPTISDRDQGFTSSFWLELMALFGVSLKIATDKQTQTDGATEVMNLIVENYLHFYCNFAHNEWDTLLPAADFIYNSMQTADLGLSICEVDLWWQPRSLADWLHAVMEDAPTMKKFRKRLKVTLKDSLAAHEVTNDIQASEAAGKY